MVRGGVRPSATDHDRRRPWDGTSPQYPDTSDQLVWERMVVMEKSPTTRRYSVEFKRDAVALYRSSGRSLREVAKELGITDISLAAWVKEADGSSDDNKRDKETAREEARLRKRIRELEEEVEILKRFTKYWVREGDK